MSVPGPGAYKTVDMLTKDGKYIISRLKDSGSMAMRQTAKRWTDENKFAKIVPGPGKYKEPETITTVGKNFISKFESSKCGKFPLSRRESTGSTNLSIFVNFENKSYTWTWGVSSAVGLWNL